MSKPSQGPYRDSAEGQEIGRHLAELIGLISEKTCWPESDFNASIVTRTIGEPRKEEERHRVVIERKGVKAFSFAYHILPVVAATNAKKEVKRASKAKLRRNFGEPFLVKSGVLDEDLQAILNKEYNNGYKPYHVSRDDNGYFTIVFEELWALAGSGDDLQDVRG